jgi:2-amino-4-hydroxy-6-hydroxymethyldihydropteridine diphosphokinase
MSSLYRTEPVDAPGQRDFLNLVCEGTTLLDARALLQHIHLVEDAGGRTRPFSNAPRTIDIDILDFDGEIADSAGLTLPHPRLHLRRFVLVPLTAITPGWRHPVLGSTAADLLATAPPARVERVLDASSLLARGGR